jgi:hypothetical protein
MWCTVRKHQRGRASPQHASQNEIPTTTHPGTSRQIHHAWICQQTNQATKIKVHGHQILLLGVTEIRELLATVFENWNNLKFRT